MKTFLILLIYQVINTVAVGVASVDAATHSVRVSADRSSGITQHHSATDVASVLKLTDLFKAPMQGGRPSHMDLSKIEESLMQIASHSVSASTASLLESILNITDQQMKVSVNEQVEISRQKILNASAYLTNCASTASSSLAESSALQAGLSSLKTDFHSCVGNLPAVLDSSDVDQVYISGPSGFYTGGPNGVWDNTPDCMEAQAAVTSTTVTTTSGATGLTGGTTVPITISGSGCFEGTYVYDVSTGTWTTNHAGNPSAPTTYYALGWSASSGCWTISEVTNTSGTPGTTKLQTCSLASTVSSVSELTSWTDASSGATITCAAQEAAATVEDLPATLTITGSHDENVLGDYIIQPQTTGPATVNGAVYYAAVWKKKSNGAELKWDPSTQKWAVSCSACGLASGCSTLLESVATTEVSPTSVPAWYVGSTNALASVQITKGTTLAKDAFQALKLAGTSSIDGMSYVSGVYLRVDGWRIWERAGNSNLAFCGTSLTSKWHVVDMARSAELLYTATSQMASLPQDALIWGPNYTQGSAATVTLASVAETLSSISNYLAGNCSGCADGSSDATAIVSLPTDCSNHQVTISSTGGVLYANGTSIASSSDLPAQLALQGASTADAYLNGRYTRDPADDSGTTKTWKRCSAGGPEIVYDSSSLIWQIKRNSGLVLFQWTAAAELQVPGLSNSWTAVSPQTQDAELRVTHAVCVGSCPSTELCTFTGDRNHYDCMNAQTVCEAFETFDNLDEIIGTQYQINANDPSGVNPATQKCLLGATAGSGSWSGCPGDRGLWLDLNIGDMPLLNSTDCDTTPSTGTDPARPHQNRPLTWVDTEGGDYFAVMKNYWQEKIAEWDAKWAACQAARDACNARTGIPIGPLPVDASFSALTSWNATPSEVHTCFSTTTTSSTTSTSSTASPTSTSVLTTTISGIQTTSTTTGTARLSGECRQMQDKLDNQSCAQGQMQIQACKDYDCCYDYVNASLYAEWEPICRSGGILENLRTEYYGVLRIECLINALGLSDAERSTAIDSCKAAGVSAYESQLPTIAECASLSWWPAHMNYPQCNEAGTLNPTVDAEISGTFAYMGKYYGELAYYHSCTSSCCYNLPDPPSPTCPDVCSCGKSTGNANSLLQQGTHQV